MDVTTVTDEMLQAARRMMPARWSMEDLRNAIASAIDTVTPTALVFEPDATLTPEQMAEWERIVADATHGHFIQVHTPALHPALDHPLVLGGITEIGQRLDAARSTVVGWTKRADKIGMPAPIAELAAGPVYDLTAVETWYRAWKAGDDGAEEDS